jgi:UDP-galactopyranose mutase
LYQTFFKTYTEKVWGIPCNKIQAEWAKQRIKGMSLKAAVISYCKQHDRSPIAIFS